MAVYAILNGLDIVWQGPYRSDLMSDQRFLACLASPNARLGTLFTVPDQNTIHYNLNFLPFDKKEIWMVHRGHITYQISRQDLDVNWKLLTKVAGEAKREFNNLAFCS